MIFLTLIPAAIIVRLGANKKISYEAAMGLYGGLCFLAGYLLQ